MQVNNSMYSNYRQIKARTAPKKDLNLQNNIAFKGATSEVLSLGQKIAKSKPYNALTDFLAKKIFVPLQKSSGVQNLVGKLKQSENYYNHLSVFGSIVLTGFYMRNTAKNKDIKKDQKLPLMINQGLVAGLAAGMTYGFNGAINKTIGKFTTAFRKELPEVLEKANGMDHLKNIKNVDEAVGKMGAGIKKLQQVLIFTLIYRYLSPVLITPIANKISGKIQDNKEIHTPNTEQKTQKTTEKK